MYWIYLALFVLAVLTPQFVFDGRIFLNEEGLESLLIFCFGTFGFMVYLAKEKTLLRVFREKLHLQKQTNIITKDLSDSYSYIGEMNRKIDIVKDLIFRLPKTTAAAIGKTEKDLYDPLLDTIALLGKTDQVAICFVHTRKKTFLKTFEKEAGRSGTDGFQADALLARGKYFWEEKGYVFVRSPRQAKSTTAFLIFEKTANHIDDSEVFQILASEALLLFCLAGD